MAGVTANDSGTPIQYHTVPTNGGTAQVAGDGHTEGDAPSYSPEFGSGPEGSGYPEGTDFGEASNPLKP